MSNTDDLLDNDTLGGGQATQSSEGGPASLGYFLCHSHTLLALYFAGPEEAPSVLLPCACCTGGVTKGVTRRHRFFLFFFVLISVFFVTLMVQLNHKEPVWLWIFGLSLVIVFPIVSRLKSDLPYISEALNNHPWKQYTGFINVEEAALFVFFIGAVIGGIVEGGIGTTASVVYHFFACFLFMQVTEFFSLIWSWLFYRICCPSCLPKEREELDTVA
mmetsp:Transcript_49426/g.77232  ORF Transcript_49426/g.77232 Transcript_49426/m.77232 type:complete len:217 (-) Transcript_49426:229-879(-)